jgi:hypothetical protein
MFYELSLKGKISLSYIAIPSKYVFIKGKILLHTVEILGSV